MALSTSGRITLEAGHWKEVSSHECDCLCYVIALVLTRTAIAVTAGLDICWQDEPMAKWAVFMPSTVPVVQALLMVDMMAT